MPSFKEGEFGRLDSNRERMIGTIRAENTETDQGYQLASGELNDLGNPKFPLWTVIDHPSRRLSTLDVVQALASTYDAEGDEGRNEQFTVITIAIDLMGALRKWAETNEPKLKNQMLYVGAVHFELAEALDFLETLREDWLER